MTTLAMLADAWPATVALSAGLIWFRTGRSPFWWLARGCLALDAAWEGTIDCACLSRLWWRRVRENWRRVSA